MERQSRFRLHYQQLTLIISSASSICSLSSIDSGPDLGRNGQVTTEKARVAIDLSSIRDSNGLAGLSGQSGVNY